MALKFWQGMAKRVGLKTTDKLMVGNVDNGDPEYIDISDLATLIGGAGGGVLRKDGYLLFKGDGNGQGNDAYEIGDMIMGVGTLYPGFAVIGYISAAPTATPDDYVTTLAAVKL